MSSNIKVRRICEHCGKEFIARTTTTRYCTHKCNSAAYKARKRAEKVNRANTETRRMKQMPMEELKAKEFLSVTEVSKLIGCSRQNIYKLINSGRLKATNILEKKTIVRRSDLDKLFDETPEVEAIPAQQIRELYEWRRAGEFEITDCYTLTEAEDKFGISSRTLYELIKRENVPKIKRGWYTYVPKSIIDELLT